MLAVDLGLNRNKLLLLIDDYVEAFSRAQAENRVEELHSELSFFRVLQSQRLVVTYVIDDLSEVEAWVVGGQANFESVWELDFRAIGFELLKSLLGVRILAVSDIKHVEGVNLKRLLLVTAYVCH